MKQTLLLTLFSFFISLFMTACTSQKAGQVTDKMVDKMAVIGNPALSSDPCAAIDEKVRKLDRFTAVVKNTSAFHLEEKASAIPTPGITVSNNRKQMLRDADKKRAEYSAERQKYGCEIPMTTGIDQTTDKMEIIDSCTAINEKVIRLDRFTEIVKNTSAFHLEEKASAIPTPGITVSNNRKQMLRDADKKRAEYSAERQKYGCETPVTTDTGEIADKMAVASKPALSSGPSAVIVKESIKLDESTIKVDNSSVVDSAEMAIVQPVTESPPSINKEQMVVAAEKKDAESSTARQTSNVEAPVITNTAQMDDKITASDNATFSSEKCNTLDEELIKLYEFMLMVNNTSAFHLEEKAAALSVPGITVSNNKKKMLKDAERKRAELLTEREKYGCETPEKK